MIALNSTQLVQVFIALSDRIDFLEASVATLTARMEVLDAIERGEMDAPLVSAHYLREQQEDCARMLDYAMHQLDVARSVESQLTVQYHASTN